MFRPLISRNEDLLCLAIFLFLYGTLSGSLALMVAGIEPPRYPKWLFLVIIFINTSPLLFLLASTVNAKTMQEECPIRLSRIFGWYTGIVLIAQELLVIVSYFSD